MSFPRYPAYKDSGVEWLGEVPSHWTVSGTGHRLRSPPCYGVLVPDFDPDGVPMLKIMDLASGVPDRSALATISEKLSNEFQRTIVRQGDLVLSVVGTIGSVLVVPESLDGVNLSRALARLLPGEDLVPQWLVWVFSSENFTRFVDMICVGSAQRVLNMDDLRSFRAPFPPVDEQTVIATFLDHETAKIDALVSEQERLIGLLKEKRQAVISHAVIKGLDPSVPMKDSGVEWLGEVPAHWEVSQLRYVVREGTSITYGIVQAGPEVEDGVPYIRTSDMSGHALPLTGYPKTSPEIDASYARSKVRAGDLVISIRASVGKCLPVPPELDGANLTQGTAKIAPSSKALAVFMLPFIGSSPVQLYLDSKAKGATFKEITLETLRKTPFLVPPLAEQEEIGRWVEREEQQFKALVETAEQAQVLLKERRNALISAAVTGQIDVRKVLDPEVMT